MSDNEPDKFLEIRETINGDEVCRSFKREKSVEFNEGTLSGEEDFFGFGDAGIEGLLLTESSHVSSYADTMSVMSELENDVIDLENGEEVSSISDIGSAVFDHDYISSYNFPENIQVAMRRSDSTDDDLRQLLYDENGVKFDLQNIEGRFKLLLNISSSLLNSRSMELADPSSLNHFMSKICEQTEHLKQKFADSDSGRASHTSPASNSKESPVLDVEDIPPESSSADKIQEEPEDDSVECLDIDHQEETVEVTSERIAALDDHMEFPVLPNEALESVDKSQDSVDFQEKPKDAMDIMKELSIRLTKITEETLKKQKEFDKREELMNSQELVSEETREFHSDSEDDSPTFVTEVEIKSEHISTYMDEVNHMEMTELTAQIDAAVKISTDFTNAIDELRNSVSQVTTMDSIVESRMIFQRKIHEFQNTLIKFAIEHNLSSYDSVAVQTEQEKPEETPEPVPVCNDFEDTIEPGEIIAEICEEIPKESEENAKETPETEDEIIPTEPEVEPPTVEEPMEQESLLVIPEFESTEIQNERMKRKLLEVLDDSTSDESIEEDDPDDPIFSIRLPTRKGKFRRRESKRDVVSDDECQEVAEPPKETPQAEEDAEQDAAVQEVPDTAEIDSESDSEFDLMNYTTTSSPEPPEQNQPEAEAPVETSIEDASEERLVEDEIKVEIEIIQDRQPVALLESQDAPVENGLIKGEIVDEPNINDASRSEDSGNEGGEDAEREEIINLEPQVQLDESSSSNGKSVEDDVIDKEIEKLLDFTALERAPRESTRSIIAEPKESDKSRKPEKKKNELLDILQEVKASDLNDSSSESSDDELTEQQFLEQCNMTMKDKWLNFGSDESEEESDMLNIGEMFRKKNAEEEDDVDSIKSDASAIVDNFLMDIVQKEIAGDVGGEESGEEEVEQDVTMNGVEGDSPAPELPKEEPSSISQAETDKATESIVIRDKDVVEIADESQEQDKNSDDGEQSKSKAPKLSGLEKIIMSDKIFEGIDGRKEKVQRKLNILSSDDESEKDHKEDGANESLDTSMFSKTDNIVKSSEEIGRLLAKYDSTRASTSRAVETTRVTAETISLSSDSDVDEVIEEEPEKETAPRRNIRAIMSDDQLEEKTKRAQREEQERIKRLEKKEDSLSQRMSQTETVSQGEHELILDYYKKKNKYVKVHPEIVRQLKPHQYDGIKFMYDNVYGGIDYVNTHHGSGCILAHCMGLGKTLQLIALLDTVIRYPELKTHKILVICPKTTIMNWYEEIKKWLKPVSDVSMKVSYFPDNYEMQAKLEILKDWHKSGQKGYRNAGCLLIGYEAFRVLVLKQTKKLSLSTPQETNLIKQQITETLLDPGADLVICDEGHIIKNRKSAINRAVTKIRTKRRIILTGTPIQNNLKEYYCMVDFIKPNFLGTEREFANLYTNPIKSGQHKDSTKQEIKCMKQRSYVLHKKLSRFVQRREASILKEFLPEKLEYVLFIPMTPVQERLYEFFLEYKPNKEFSGKSLIPDYTALRKIWTHPKVLEIAWENAVYAKERRERTRARLHPESDDEVPDDVLDKQSGDMSVTSDWWRQHLSQEDLESLLPSNKLRLVFEILKLCQQNREKCLIFSAFVAVLNVVEYFMKKISSKDPNAAKYGLGDYDGPWEHGKDYYRLDGKTPKQLRHSMVQSFNDPRNTRMRCFLISARAGGQGINLTGANRVIILDTSWNPSNDQQNIFRIYRLGQTRKCFIYRLLAMGTMEEKVYSRSVTKQAMSFRVVDEQQIDRHYNMAELAELYTLTKTDISQRPVPNLPMDFLLRSLLHNHYNLVYKYHEHDSLLENKPEQDLSEADKKEAWDAYENDLKTQRFILGNTDATGFDQNALNANLLGMSNYFNAGNANMPGMNFTGPNLPGRPSYGANYTGTLNPSMSLLNQLAYPPGIGLNQDPMLLMNQLYQSYPMGMGSSGLQNPYMGYLNSSSYLGGGMYPPGSSMGMLPDTNIIPTTQNGNTSGGIGHLLPTTTSGPTLPTLPTSTSTSAMQRSVPNRSMWNMLGSSNFYNPVMQSSAQTQNATKTTPSSTMVSSNVQSSAAGSAQMRQLLKTPQKSPHTSIPTSVITTMPAPTTPGSSLSKPTFSRSTSERPGSSTSPEPHVIFKSSTPSPGTPGQKEKEPPVSKVTNMGIVYPTVEPRDSGVPSLSSLTPATITKILKNPPVTTNSPMTPQQQKDSMNAKLSNFLGINAVLQNVTVTPSTKTPKTSATTLTPIVTTTVKSGGKVIQSSPNKPSTTVSVLRKTSDKLPTPAEIIQNLQNVSVKPTTSVQPSSMTMTKSRQPYVTTARGKKAIQPNQKPQHRIVVANSTSITPVAKLPKTPITATKVVNSVTATLTKAPSMGQLPTSVPKVQGAHLTRISRLVPSSIQSTTPSNVSQSPRLPTAIGRSDRILLAKKSTPAPMVPIGKPSSAQMAPIVRPPSKTITINRSVFPSTSVNTTPTRIQPQQGQGLKRPATTNPMELISNSRNISITQVKRPNLQVKPSTASAPPPLAAASTLQKVALQVRRTVNKVPPTVVTKDPEIVELD
ncbi:transcriptional regulator ATRX [Sergentomyia squamirostris]